MNNQTVLHGQININIKLPCGNIVFFNEYIYKRHQTASFSTVEGTVRMVFYNIIQYIALDIKHGPQTVIYNFSNPPSKMNFLNCHSHNVNVKFSENLAICDLCFDFLRNTYSPKSI